MSVEEQKEILKEECAGCMYMHAGFTPLSGWKTKCLRCLKDMLIAEREKNRQLSELLKGKQNIKNNT
jgi:hypothetical protein